MRLKFKSQSTNYTCAQATQAIALNSLLGTDYTDLDVVTASGKGYPISTPVIGMAQHLARRNRGIAYDGCDYELRTGVLKILTEKHEMPSLQEAVHAYMETEISSIDRYEKSLRANPVIMSVGPNGSRETAMTTEDMENSIRKVRANLSREMDDVLKINDNPAAQAFYAAFIEELYSGLLMPIAYKYYLASGSADFSGMTNLSGGRIVAEPCNPEEITVPDGAVYIFGASRKVLGLPQLTEIIGHSWVVDRTDGNKVVLLDTNHKAYEHGPEISVNKEILLGEGIGHPTRMSLRK